MSPEDRRAEIAALLARGARRARVRVHLAQEELDGPAPPMAPCTLPVCRGRSIASCERGQQTESHQPRRTP